MHTPVTANGGEKETDMAKTYTCRDVGVDCDWKAAAQDENVLMAKIEQHAAQAHSTIVLTPDLVAAVRGAFKDN